MIGKKQEADFLSQITPKIYNYWSNKLTVVGQLRTLIQLKTLIDNTTTNTKHT